RPGRTGCRAASRRVRTRRVASASTAAQPRVKLQMSAQEQAAPQRRRAAAALIVRCAFPSSILPFALSWSFTDNLLLAWPSQCRVDTRPGQCGGSNLQGGNHAFPHSETIRDLPVRCAQGAGVRTSKVWKKQVISPPQETGCRTDASSRSRLPECLRWGVLL